MLLDVVRIIAKYVMIDDLASFFLEYGVDFRIRFKYDAFYQALGVRGINNIFEKFPNIIMTGAFFNLHFNTIDSARIQYCQRLKILSDGVINFAQLAKCINLRILICRGKCVDVEKIYDLSKLRYLELSQRNECSYDVVRIASNFPKLRHIYVPFKDKSEVVHFSNLKSIVLSGRVCGRDIVALRQLKRLKYVKFNYCSFDDVLDLSGCSNLRRLEIVCSGIKVINGLDKIMNLRYIDINYCHDLISITDLEKCVNLVSIELKFCTRLISANVVNGCTRKIIFCPGLAR